MLERLAKDANAIKHYFGTLKVTHMYIVHIYRQHIFKLYMNMLSKPFEVTLPTISNNQSLSATVKDICQTVVHSVALTTLTTVFYNTCLIGSMAALTEIDTRSMCGKFHCTLLVGLLTVVLYKTDGLSKLVSVRMPNMAS